jgi:signal transduction histidine kinase
MPFTDPERRWLDRSTWLFGLLLVLMLLPAAAVLWFMNEAVTTQQAAARQQVLESYRGQLRLVRSRIDAHWRAQAARLQGGGTPAHTFATLIAVEEAADGAVLLGADGTVTFPDRGEDPPQETLEEQLAGLERRPPSERREHAGALAARLNDYTLEMSASQRLTLMDRLRALTPNIGLPTQAALRLSTDLVAAERPSPKAGGLRETALPGVWALTSDDHRAIALYRTGRLEAVMHDFLHQVTPAGIRFIAVPPGDAGGAEAIAAGPWMPGWQITFQPLDMTPFETAGRRRVLVYVSVGVGGLAVMAMVGAAAGRTFRRQLHLARLKTDLAAAVSHELRTPLASMRVLVDGLLADDEIDPGKAREYLHMMAGEHARLGRLIENFLTFSRLDRNRYTFTFAAAHPAAIVAAAVDAVRDRVPSTAALRVDVAPDLPALVVDASALSTALVNLLDNALKYTPDDKHIQLQARRDGDGFVSFVVEDNGIGIPPREQRRIFRRYYRVDRRLSQERGGVGLGLSIVDLVARAHRGTISVRSESGAGSTFTLRLPCMPAGATA